MQKKGAKTVPLSIRIPEGTVQRIDDEVEKYREFGTRSEFIVEATKHFLDYKLRMHIDTCRILEGNDFTAEYDRGGGGARSVDQLASQEKRN
ncbi:MAG: ribbon-helix-helix domain-containing protein [Candidatus Methanoplasma sp.]|nr:ribbon-helix-helix domain-containing protein [Candidatus Methanoplasma sp.]